MKAWNVSESQIREAAQACGLKIHSDWAGSGIVRDGRALRFRLAVDPTATRNPDTGDLPYQRISQAQWREGNPRRIAAVCWHGHRDFMARLFALEPDARLKTALADYRGRDSFLDLFPATADRGGNGWNLSYGEACRCDRETHDRDADAWELSGAVAERGV